MEAITYTPHLILQSLMPNSVGQRTSDMMLQKTIIENEGAAKLGRWQFSASSNALTGCVNFQQLFDLVSRPSWNLADLIFKIDKEERAKFIFQIKMAMRTGMISVEISLLPNSAKDRRWIRVTGSIQIMDDSRDCRLNGHAEDITVRKKIESAKDEFPDYLNHQIRNPLTTIQLYMQMIEKKARNNKDTDLVDWAGKANEQLQALEMLTSTYLDRTALSNGHIPLKKSRFQLHKYLSAFAENLRQLYPERIFDLQLGSFPSVHADQCKIEEVMQNLISNALKYSFPGSPITIQGKSERKHYRIAVVNYGIGISSDEIGRLFEKYYRTKQSVCGEAKGHGLGLHLVKRIIEQHGGQVGVNCLEKDLIEFFITIPLQNGGD